MDIGYIEGRKMRGRGKVKEFRDCMFFYFCVILKIFKNICLFKRYFILGGNSVRFKF